MEPMLRPYVPCWANDPTEYDFSYHHQALLEYLGIASTRCSNRTPIDDDWLSLFNVSSSRVFSSSAAYGARDARATELVTLGTVINRWERFINHMAAKLAV